MRYFVCSNKEGRIDIIKEYADENNALKRLKYHLKKEKCRLEIIPVPELKIGCRIYKADGNLYGKIVYETENLWGIEVDEKGIPDPYSKQRIDGWIVGHGLIIVDDESGDMASMVKERESIELKVDEVLKNLEYINTKQVSFFKA